MPKRDALYMETQREIIARAALKCVLEKGVAATSTREVCLYAEVSKGALYRHFKTREELILAACALDPIIAPASVDNWTDYEARLWLALELVVKNERYRQIARVGYELLAESVLAGRALPGIDEQWDHGYDFIRTSLGNMHEQGEISLPLGLQPTMELHAQMATGAMQGLLGDRRLNLETVGENFRAALAFTAGRQVKVTRGKGNSPASARPKQSST